MGECVQANVHKDALVESVVVLYPRVCDVGATVVPRLKCRQVA
jgi:hypothetical protein